ncbi:MAG: YIP1 family protein [Candidatus Sulfotelmatobacter sp.]
MAADPLPRLSASVTTPEAAPLSEGARIVNTFITLSKTFTDLHRNANWWGPWLLISIISLLFVHSMDRQIGFDQITKNEIGHSSRADQFDKLPADQQAKQIRFSSSLIRYLSYGIPVMILFYFAITGLVLWATFKFGTGANVSYKTAYAIVFYAALPGVIGSVLGAISVFAGVSPEGFNVNNPVATNPVYFMDPTANKFLYGMASALDVIAIWTIVLLGIGFSCNSKVKRTTAIVIVARVVFILEVGRRGTRGPVLEAGCNSPRDRNVLNLQCAG